MTSRLDKTGLLEFAEISQRYNGIIGDLTGCRNAVLHALGNAITAYNTTELSEAQAVELDTTTTVLAAARQEYHNLQDTAWIAAALAPLAVDIPSMVVELENHRTRLSALPNEIDVLQAAIATIANTKVEAGLSAYTLTVGKQIRIGGSNRGHGTQVSTAGRVAKRAQNGVEYFIACQSDIEWYAYSYTGDQGFCSLFDYKSLPGVAVGSPSKVNNLLKLWCHGYKAKAENDKIYPAASVDTLKAILGKPRKTYPIYSSGNAGITFVEDQSAGDWLSFVASEIATKQTRMVGASESESEIAE